MNLLNAKEGEEYIVKDIATEDEDRFSIFLRLLQRRADYSSFSSERRMRRFY